ncbi:MAG: galactokinase [Lachnospiraceae bacterium]|nr:galactokinase [Lachnospiraceae bacterium]
MLNLDQIINDINEGRLDDKLLDIYVDESKLSTQKDRYINALNEYKKLFTEELDGIYSAPGRSEIGGNHTDHQHGETLAASINDDAIAMVKSTDKNVVNVLSEGYDMITIDLNDIDKKDSEEGTTIALIKGVIKGVKDHGYNIGGFNAYITSNVLSGSGLSSSAAFETLIGTILSGLYNDMKIPAVEIAIIGQYAENYYFGKPCGLLDQTASSVGGLCHMDFINPKEPAVTKVDFDMESYGYSLCITDTKGSHADLTDDYAAVPKEMKEVASFFGKEVLIEVDEADVIKNAAAIREKYSDRAFLRAIHFYEENKRVNQEVEALKTGDIDTFLKTVNASGNSSYKYLQNVYTNHDVEHQNVSVALMLSELFLGNNGVARVHGGGFAGTIQAFVKNEAVADYKKKMDIVFGDGACNVLKIRKYGGMKVL